MFDIGGMWRNLGGVTKNLIIINLLMFVITMIFNQQAGSPYALQQELGMHYPGGSLFRPYQIVTHMFMHGGFGHVFMNMFVLFFAGAWMEREWGAKKFLIFYFVCGLGATVLSEAATAVQWYQLTGMLDIPESSVLYNDPYIRTMAGMYSGIPSVGASGAVYGVLIALAVYYPDREVRLYFLIPIKLKYLAFGLIAIALWSGFNPQGDGIAHFAHLGGAVMGYFIARTWKRNRYRYR